MAIVIDQSFLFNNVQFGYYSGKSTGSYGSNDLIGLFSTVSLTLPAAKDAEMNTTNLVTFGYNVYYKMQGWNPISQVYEDWHSMGTPLLSPPSGNSLENIGIIGTWIDR